MAAFNAPEQQGYDLYDSLKEYEQGCYQSYDGDNIDLVCIKPMFNFLANLLCKVCS